MHNLIVLLQELFLELSDDKQYVSGNSAGSKATVSFHVVIIDDGRHQHIQGHLGQDSSFDGEKCYPSVVRAVKILSLLFANGY